MDSINVDKIQALRKYKEQQFVGNMLFYPLVILAFFLFCTSPLWFPSFYGSSKTLMCVSIPSFVSLFFNVKSLFLLGNLIVIFLLRESKLRPINNGDDLLKPILSKIGSKKAKMHTVREMGSKVRRPLSPNCTDNNRQLEKITPPHRGFEEVKMHTASSPHMSRIVFSEGLSESKGVSVETRLNDKICRFGYVETQGRQSSWGEVEDEKGEVVKEESMWQVKDERRQNEGKELIIHAALSTHDELKQRADDFIAMVNMQIRLEAEDVFLDAC